MKLNQHIDFAEVKSLIDVVKQTCGPCSVEGEIYRLETFAEVLYPMLKNTDNFDVQELANSLITNSFMLGVCFISGHPFDINYKDLLTKYLGLVKVYEGRDLIDQAGSVSLPNGCRLSGEEIQALEALSALSDPVEPPAETDDRPSDAEDEALYFHGLGVPASDPRNWVSSTIETCRGDFISKVCQMPGGEIAYGILVLLWKKPNGEPVVSAVRVQSAFRKGEALNEGTIFQISMEKTVNLIEEVFPQWATLSAHSGLERKLSNINGVDYRASLNFVPGDLYWMELRAYEC